tara:strand:+ start:246 stop:506 length:261 start_codon:yes stop_codon:yes gene_type:complete
MEKGKNWVNRFSRLQNNERIRIQIPDTHPLSKFYYTNYRIGLSDQIDLDNPYDEMINGPKKPPEKVESFPGEFELNIKMAKKKNKK